MPFEKVIITHKFGIISQSHKKQLQERLLLRRIELENDSKTPKKSDDVINLQITEEFVKQYNDANFEKKGKLDFQCLQMFEKIKKRLIGAEIEDDLSIQLAWAELSQLMQCNSPIQEECLDLFIVSLEYAPLSALQIPTLFFLAETVIYWIRTDTINQPFLRAFEIKLLKVGQLIFQRIYFYFLDDNNIENQSDLKEHLHIYLQGFEEYQHAYSPYPDALLYMRYMIAVGKFITKDVLPKKDSEPKEPKFETKAEITTNSGDSTRSDNQISLAKLIYSPIFWQLSNLYLYLTKRNSEKFIEPVIENLIDSSSSIKQEYWIDSSHAFYILGECAKLNVKALNALLTISNFVPSSSFADLMRNSYNSSNKEDENSQSSQSDLKKNGIDFWPWELGHTYVDVLTDIVINGSHSAIRKKALLGFHKEASQVFDLKLKELKGYGLLDTARFNLKKKKDMPDNVDWKIRYASIKGLVNICNSLVDKDNEELRKTCWACLIVCQENETNKNVLEAIKVGQIKSKFENPVTSNQLNKNGILNLVAFKLNNENKNIFCQMAKRFTELIVEEEKREAESILNQKKEIKIKSDLQSKLSEKLGSSFYDEKIEDNNSIKFENVPYGRLEAKSKPSLVSTQQEKKLKKNRTTLKEEIEISQQFQQKIPKYFVRKNFDLMRIVEDQYRKEEKEKFEKSIENSHQN